MQSTLRFDQKVTLQEIITDNEPLCAGFVEYLASIHAMEAFEFWIEVELYKRIQDEEECTKTAKFIFTTYLSPHSPSEINLEGRTRRELLENFSKNQMNPNLFNKAQDSVEMMLKYDCLRVFLDVNKGKVSRKSTSEPKKGKDSTLLLQRYNALIKQEKKKVRRESFKKSISGSLRRLTANTDQPKSIASAPKSNSFGMERDLRSLGSSSEVEREGGNSEGEGERRIRRRARGKKIRLDPSRRWVMAVGEWDNAREKAEEKEKEEQKTEEEREKEKERDRETNPERETEGEEKEEKRSETPRGTDWVAYEKPLPMLNQAGSTEWLVGGVKGREEERIAEGETLGGEKGHPEIPEISEKPDILAEVNRKRSDAVREKRKSGGGLRFLCFGGAKKKP